jgi:hypothetical protein
LSRDDGAPSLYPDIGFASSGVAAITWFDERDGNGEIYAAVAPSSVLMRTTLSHMIRVTHTPTPSMGAYLAWRGSRFTIVWCDAQTGRYELYAGSFDANGRQLGAIRRVSHARANAGVPSLRPMGDRLLVAWNDYASSKSSEGHADRLRSTAMVTRVE